MSASRVRFACANCGTAVQADRRLQGKRVTCRACRQPTRVPVLDAGQAVAPQARPVIPPPVPGTPQATPVARAKRRRQDPAELPWVVLLDEDDNPSTVDVFVTGPKGLATMKTKVTQKTADNMATTFLGGMLVAVGAVLMAIILGRPPKQG